MTVRGKTEPLALFAPVRPDANTPERYRSRAKRGCAAILEMCSND